MSSRRRRGRCLPGIFRSVSKGGQEQLSKGWVSSWGTWSPLAGAGLPSEKNGGIANTKKCATGILEAIRHLDADGNEFWASGTGDCAGISPVVALLQVDRKACDLMSAIARANPRCVSRRGQEIRDGTSGKVALQGFEALRASGGDENQWVAGSNLRLSV